MHKTAFLFPGQGSQSIGMLEALSRQSDLVKNTFSEASQIVGCDLWKIAQQGPEELLNQTEVTQPAMLAAGVSSWRVWKEQGGFDPDFMAGHSLGEYTSLVAAGSLEFETAVELVAERAKRMQAATPTGTGAMAAVLGLDEFVLGEICAAAAQGQVVSCANYNSPEQIVIAGEKAAVDRACAQARDAGAKRVVLLAVSIPSHCSLMRSAAMEFGLALASAAFVTGGIPVLHNVNMKSHSTAQEIRIALEQQMWQPVRWTGTILELASRGVSRFAECGPGKVLTGLNRRIVREAETIAMQNIDIMKRILGAWS